MTNVTLEWLIAIGTSLSLILFTISCLMAADNLTSWRDEK